MSFDYGFKHPQCFLSNKMKSKKQKQKQKPQRQTSCETQSEYRRNKDIRDIPNTHLHGC